MSRAVFHTEILFKNVLILFDFSLPYVDTITEEMLKFWTRDMKFEAENGTFDVFIGKNSACHKFASFELK